MAMILSTKCSSSSSPTIPLGSVSTSRVYSHNGSCSRIQKPLKIVSFSPGRRSVNGQHLSTKAQAIPEDVIINEVETETINANIGSLLTPKPTTLVKEVLHMNGGIGDTSYTKNSSIQKKGMMNVKFTLQENIRDLLCSMKPHCLKFADLGCSSGPNAFSPLREIIETINQECVKTGEGLPAIQAYLNDLPGNDFNNLFNLLSSFQRELDEGKFNGPCFVSALPGSFHGRLFPDESIHFFHSSFAINWLSQVPKRLVSENGTHLNKGNICMAKTSPTSVRGAYSNQFETDFSNFLNARSKELTRGGRMVIAMMGSNDNRGPTLWELLGTTLNDMVSEGLVDETTLDSFNIRFHSPCREEVRSVIHKEGSFRLLRLETFRLNWDGDAMIKDSERLRFDNVERGKRMSMTLRAAGESVLEDHFGHEITDSLFCRHSNKVAEYLDCVGEGMWTNHVLSLIKD